MNTTSTPAIKYLSCLVLFIAMTSSLFAQKGEKPGITKEQIEQVNKITEPVRKTMENLLAKEEMYINYQRDLKALSATKNLEQRMGMTKKIIATYEGFFSKVWAKAGVDEKSYQAKIKAVFPAPVAETITFQAYLGFTIFQTSTYNPAPPPPPRNNICMTDVCSKAAGEVNGDSYLISGGGGNYGKCFIKAHAWGAVAAGGSLSTILKNNLSIPGDFPQDSRRLLVTIDYDVKLEATAFAVLGLSVASASVSCRQYENTEYMMVFSPIIFANSRVMQKTRSDNYTIEKNQIGTARIGAGSSVITAVISGSWGNAEANNIRWTICETK